MGRKACLLGATGLIGSQLLELLLRDPYYEQIHILVRKPVPQTSGKLVVHVIDFADEKQYRPAIEGAETVFSAIGTTLKKVNGDRNAYKKIDYDINLFAATTAAASGVYSYVLVSSIGADATNNNNFYLKLKGVVEEAVSKQRIPQIHIFRPSLLLGKRDESRLGEGLAQTLAPVFSPFMGGGLRKYKPIKAEEVAAAMLAAAKTTKQGIFIHEYDSIMKFISGPHPV